MNEHRRIVGRPFPRGQSGNPGGRPKELREVVELAKAHGPDAVAALADIMNNPESPPAARVAAANALLDRGYGKPAQAVAHVGAVGMHDFSRMSDEELKAFIMGYSPVAIADSDVVG